MANSTRHQIMDAVIAALGTIKCSAGYQTDLTTVSERWKGYQQVLPKELPAAYPIDGDEKRSPAMLGIGQDHDTQAVLTVNITCIVYDKDGDVRQKRTDLMRDIEKAMMNDATVASLIAYIEPADVTTDGGTIDNYSIWDQSYELTYTYSSVSGG